MAKAWTLREGSFCSMLVPWGEPPLRWFRHGSVFVQEGACADVMNAMPEGCVDAVVTDPPYGLEFLGKAFDKLGTGAQQQEWHRRWLVAAHHALKPEGYIDAFSGTRTFHRLAAAMVEAGFGEPGLRAWCYGSGFPKSMNIGKAIDKAAGAKRPVVGVNPKAAQQTGQTGTNALGDRAANTHLTGPATPEAAQWEGYGTALKPAWEPVLRAHPGGKAAADTGLRVVYLLRKPVGEKTVAANCTKYGTGALNIEGCRLPTGEIDLEGQPVARWPANLLLIHAPGCRPGGTAEFKSGAGTDTMTPTTHEGVAKFGYSPKRRQFNYGTETVQQWACAYGCPVGALARETRVTRSTGGKHSGKNALGQDSGWNAHSNRPVEIKRPSDKGTAARYFWQGAEKGAVVGYLSRLVTPPPHVAAAPGEAWATLNADDTPARIAEALERLRPGGHLLLASTDASPTGWRAACAAEDAGFEVRDAVLLAGPGTGGAFRYQAKAAKKEREAGLDHLRVPGQKRANRHPTVKPLAIMRWLLAMVPAGAVVMEPFAGSGTTLCAAALEGRGLKVVGAEKNQGYRTARVEGLEADYVQIIEGRVRHWYPSETP